MSNNQFIIGFTGMVVGDGKITIPKEIRELLNIKQGDLIEIKIVRVHRR